MLNNLVPIIVLVVALVFVFLIQSSMARNYDYQCRNCGQRFSLSIWQAMLAPHRLGSRLVRCPQCGKVTWAEPVPKD